MPTMEERFALKHEALEKIYADLLLNVMEHIGISPHVSSWSSPSFHIISIEPSALSSQTEYVQFIICIFHLLMQLSETENKLHIQTIWDAKNMQLDIITQQKEGAVSLNGANKAPF